MTNLRYQRLDCSRKAIPASIPPDTDLLPTLAYALGSLASRAERKEDVFVSIATAATAGFLDVGTGATREAQLRRHRGLPEQQTGKRVRPTENGEGSAANQLGHARDVFSELDNEIDRLDRIYIFTDFDGEGCANTYGLVANDGNRIRPLPVPARQPVSNSAKGSSGPPSRGVDLA